MKERLGTFTEERFVEMCAVDANNKEKERWIKEGIRGIKGGII